MYKRVLLKLSGEQLAGKFDSGIDAEFCGWLADQIKQVSEAGTQVVIMVGGGNYARGAQLAGHGIKRVTADHVGMLATLMNAIAVTDIFEARGVATRCLSNIFAQQVAESFSFRLAEKHLQAGRVVIVAGGIGRPYLTTDTAAVSLALEMDCNIVMKATKVNGVYDKDPAEHVGATHIPELSFQNAVENSHIKVMDKAAMALAMDHNMPIMVFDAMVDGSIARVAKGDQVGTLIS